MIRVLVTCPPMLGMVDEFMDFAVEKGLELVPVPVVQTLSEAELIQRLPNFEGWIIGDDPATRAVFAAGRNGSLRAAVRWGIGTDNVDLAACKDLGIPIVNTPMMFGGEVADVALAYVIGLARQLFMIDREVRESAAWPKPPGVSLAGKRAGVVGFGNIGQNVARRLIACGMNVSVYDPAFSDAGEVEGATLLQWPLEVDRADFLVFTCALTKANRHMLNEEVLRSCKQGIYVVNVARGALIDEAALVAALRAGIVAGAALDVFEQEPLPSDSPLREFPACIFGSHNSSNTRDAVRRTSITAIEKLHSLLSR